MQTNTTVTRTFVCWEDLTLANDFMFRKVMAAADEDVCRELAERILGIKVERIEYVPPQPDAMIIQMPYSVRFKVYVADSDRVLNFEIQLTDKGNLPFRARYCQSSIDAGPSHGRWTTRDLKESWVVFLCTVDPFEEGRPVYKVLQEFVDQPGEVFDNGTHKVFYNCTAYRKEKSEPIRNLLEYLACGTVRDGFTDRLERLVKDARKNSIWRMEYIMLEMIKRDEWWTGFTISAEQIARNMLNKGYDIAEISELTGLSPERVRELAGTEPVKER